MNILSILEKIIVLKQDNGNFMLLTKFPSPVTPEVVNFTTSSTPSEASFVKMTFCFSDCTLKELTPKIVGMPVYIALPN